MATIAQDNFAESGTGTANLTTHTADIGGTWGAKILTNLQQALINKDNDYIQSNTTISNNYQRLGSGALSDGDVYITWMPVTADPSGNWGSVVARISSDNFYAFSFRDDVVDSAGAEWQLRRITAGSVTVVSSGSGDTLGGADARVRFQTSGSSPTTLRARYWTGDEPGTWAVNTTENTAANRDVIRRVRNRDVLFVRSLWRGASRWLPRHR